MASGEIVRSEYDPITGDMVAERWLNAPATSTDVLLERQFDVLGRVTDTTYRNLALANFGVSVADATVHQSFEYDALGRTLEETTTARGLTLPTTSSYTDTAGGWRREVGYPTATVLHEERDVAGRLAVSTRPSPSDSSHTVFSWLGDVPAGRAYSNADLDDTDPFREHAEHDGFGRRTGWEYAAIDHFGHFLVNEDYADTYCNGLYESTRCFGPLLRIDAIRDVMGRITSLESRFGHPMNAGRPLPDSEHDTDWRGFQYDPRGYFDREWLSLGPDVDTSTIVPNVDPASVDPALDTLGGQIGASPWDQHRETNVGGLTAIVNPDTREELWGSTKARDPGHRLSEVRVDFTTYGITHDDAGRLTHGLDADFVYHPNNRLAAAFGAQKEFYLYTADGDLAAVGRGIGRDQVFAYDGAQMIASYDADTGAPLWEATWGDGIDQLVEYRDFGAGSPVVPIVDHRNSAVATWSPAAIAVEQLARYDAHGRLTLLDATESQICAEQGNPGVVCSAPSGMPFAFNGRWRSPVTGLVNMRARWYSPRLGQFTAPDPLGYIRPLLIVRFRKTRPDQRVGSVGPEHVPHGGRLSAVTESTSVPRKRLRVAGVPAR